MINGKTEIDGLSILKPEYLIPLKIKAWSDLRKQKTNNNQKRKIDSNDIRKHRNDIFKLIQIIDPDQEINIPEIIKIDIQEFLSEIINDSIDLKNIRINNSIEFYLSELKRFYSIY